MPDHEKIEVYSEEVQELMGEIPNSIIRWGITVLFVLFAGLIVGSFFFKSPETVSAPLVITTANPPAPVISKSSGRIAQWFVNDGQNISPGGNIALISNPASLGDILSLEKTVSFIDSMGIENTILETTLPEKPTLGELQEQYNTFSRNWLNYRSYLESNFIPRKIELLGKQIKKQEEQYRLSIDQKTMLEKELNYTRRGVERRENMLEKGGVSESQMEEAKARVLQAERGYTGFLSGMKSEEINLISQKRTLLELEEQHKKETEGFEQAIAENLRTLKNQLLGWCERYLLSSPVSGKVTFTKFWGENHVVNAGERLATVVPSDTSEVICRAVVSSAGVGKLQPGQKVNIKLAGFPYMEYGMLTGTVHTISLVPDEKGYTVEIRLSEGLLSTYREKLLLVQEMDGTAEIITRDTRLIYRFINPLKALMDKK